MTFPFAPLKLFFQLVAALPCQVAISCLCALSSLAHTWDGGGGANSNFNNSANWNPDAVLGVADTAQFNLGSASTYSVKFPGDPFDPINYVTDRLLVNSNTVSFVEVLAASTYRLNNATTTESGRGIIIGQSSADVAVLNSSLVSLSGVAATIGDAANSTGTLNLTSGTFSLSGNSGADSELIVGNHGAGTVNLTNGAQFNITSFNGSAVLGNYQGAVGVVTVSGDGSTWDQSASGSAFGLVVGNNGSGSLGIINGGHLSADLFTIGNASTATGTVLVDGVGSLGTFESIVVGGDGGTGTLTITNGAHVNDTGQQDSVGKFGNGTVYVTGAGSVWNHRSVVFGGNGLSNSGKMIISAGCLVATNTGLALGALSASVGVDSPGEVLVTGTGSTWNCSAELRVGGGDVGTLKIEAGATATSRTGVVALGGNKGTVTVTGSGSTWNISSELDVGYGGAGTLNILNGAIVSSQQGELGLSGQGVATINGAGSAWHNGGLSVRGLLNLQSGGRVSAVQTVFVRYGGTIQGDGTGIIAGNLSNSGSISPGHLPGSLRIEGDFSQEAYGGLNIELASATSFAKLEVTGTATIGGTLNVALLGNYAPMAGQSFNILDWGTISGTFSTLQLPPIPGGLNWNTSQLYTTGVISVAIPGDYNLDGTVDAADYVVWRKTGINGPTGYDTWRTNFGEPGGSESVAGANATVPEPTTLVMLMLAAAGVSTRRRWRTWPVSKLVGV